MRFDQIITVLAAHEAESSEMSMRRKIWTELIALRAENERLQCMCERLAHDAGQKQREIIRLRTALRQCLDVNGDDATMRRIEMIVQAALDAAGGK